MLLLKWWNSGTHNMFDLILIVATLLKLSIVSYQIRLSQYRVYVAVVRFLYLLIYCIYMVYIYIYIYIYICIQCLLEYLWTPPYTGISNNSTNWKVTIAIAVSYVFSYTKLNSRLRILWTSMRKSIWLGYWSRTTSRSIEANSETCIWIGLISWSCSLYDFSCIQSRTHKTLESIARG